MQWAGSWNIFSIKHVKRNIKVANPKWFTLPKLQHCHHDVTTTINHNQGITPAVQGIFPKYMSTKTNQPNGDLSKSKDQGEQRRAQSGADNK